MCTCHAEISSPYGKKNMTVSAQLHTTTTDVGGRNCPADGLQVEHTDTKKLKKDATIDKIITQFR